MKVSTNMRARTLASVTMFSLAAALAATPALAADEAQGSEDTASSGGLAEIVVTAQHRQENLQDVPIAVTAVSSEALADGGVGATNTLSQMIPAVQFTRSGPSGLFFLRGVGTTNAAAGEEGANAVYVDGVYMPDLGQTINNFNNVERIEVLKGPQGTLFGRNATGGLIHVITRDPGDEVLLKGNIGYGNFKTVTGQFYAGGPITDNLGWDVAFSGQDQGKGWGRNVTLNKDWKLDDHWGLRSKAVFRASDAVKFTLIGDYYTIHDNTALGYNIERGTVGSTGVVSTARRQDTQVNDLSETRLKIWGVSFKGEADIGLGTLTSITSYRKNNNHSGVDVDGGPRSLVRLAYASSSEAFQQEVRLASNSTDPLSWQVGAFYLNTTAVNDQQQRGLGFAPAGLLGQNIFAELKSKSLAAFAELTYAITPTTHLTGGIRYTEDKRKFDGSATPVKLDGTLLTPAVQGIPRLSYNEITWRASLRQDITDNINVYVSANRGFKSGSYSLQAPTNAPYKPQFITAYEIGLKSELFDRRLRLNIAAYHYDIDNYQIRSSALAAPGSSVILNAATVKVDGFDAEFEAAPTDHLTLFGGFTVLDSRYGRFGGPGAAIQAPIVYPNYSTPPAGGVCPLALRGTRNPGVLGTGNITGGWTTCLGDASGLRTPLAPKLSVSLGGTYKIPVGNEGEVRLTALYSYNDGFVFEPDNQFKQPSYSLLNGSIEYRVNENWGVEVWGNNLTNTYYFQQKATSGTGTTTVPAAPRTYGVRLKLEY